MLLPVVRIDARVLDGVAAVDHHIVAHIDADVRRAGGVIGFLKEDQVARLGVGRRDIGTDIAQSFGAKPPHIPAHTAVIDDPADKAGTVKTGAGRAAAPDI